MLGLVFNACTFEDRAKCSEEHPDPEHLAYTCGECDKTRLEEVSPRAIFMLSMHRLSKAGFPFDEDTLDLEDWLELGAISEALSEAREQKRWQQLLKLMTSRSR